MTEDHLAEPVHRLKRKIRIFFFVKVVITTINRKDKQEEIK